MCCYQKGDRNMRSLKSADKSDERGGNSLNFSYMRKHREYTDSSLYTQKQGNRFGEN